MEISGDPFDLDDIELRTRALPGVGSVPLTPLSPTATPAGLSALSSIQAIENKETPQFRPDLPFPKRAIPLNAIEYLEMMKKNPMRGLIDSHLESERLAEKGSRFLNEDIERLTQEIGRLNAEKQEALEKEAEAVKSRTTWTTLSTVAQYIGSTASFVLGWAAWAVSPIAGGLLIASGGLGLLSRIGSDTPLFNIISAWCTKSDELQRKICSNIEMGAFYLQMGFGLAGGVMAWQAGALAAAQAAGMEAGVVKAASIVTTASGIVSASSQVGAAVYNKKVADFQTQIRLASGQITTDQHTMYQQSSELSRLVESLQSKTEELRKVIQALQVQID